MSTRTILGFFGLALLLGCRPPTPDSVILIVVDTLRADHLGFYGYDRSTSPRLDDWARRGVVFEQALSTSPWTLPTFGSILTGLIPSEHGAGERARESGKRWKRAPLRESVFTLPEALSNQGWQTAAVVSNPFLREHFGLSRGFDIYDYQRGRTADQVIDTALTVVEQLQEKPFFLMVHLIDPHLPYSAPKAFRGKFSGGAPTGEIGKSRKEIVSTLDDLSADDRQHIVDRYDEEIAFVDQEVGRFLDQLDQLGIFDHSLVVLTSDHGEELFDHGDFEHGHSMHQELLRVPLVMWETNLEPRREPAPFSLVDFAQTIYAATQRTTNPSLSGSSRWESIRKVDVAGGRPIVAENTLWSSEQKVLVRWPHKLILHEKSGRRELYDLENDPLEHNDLANLHPDIADRLVQALTDRLSSTASDPSRESMIISDETEQELRSLGYLD